VLVVLKQLTIFIIPAFLFGSGFFLAFTLRGQTRPTTAFMKHRLVNLIIPYLFWSLLVIVGRIFDDGPQPWHQYLANVASTGVFSGYYFVPLLVQLYVVGFVASPVIVQHPWKALGLAGVVQLGAMTIWYLNQLGTSPALASWAAVTAYWVFPRSIFWFVFGFVVCLRQADVTRFLERRRKLLTVALVVLALCAIVGPELLYWARGIDARSSPMTITGTPYATLFILWFLSLKGMPASLNRHLQGLASRSYGIYLMHGPVMEMSARAIRHWAPAVLAHQAVFMPTMFLMGLAVPLLAMAIVKRTRLQPAYRVLFG